MKEYTRVEIEIISLGLVDQICTSDQNTPPQDTPVCTEDTP